MSTMDIQSLSQVFGAAAEAYGADLRRYWLIPSGSRNGLTERNIPLAIAKEVARRDRDLQWTSLVEVPFQNPLSITKRQSWNSRLDMILVSNDAICCIECKQFYMSWHTNEEDGIGRDLRRLVNQPAVIRELTAKRMPAGWKGRIFVAGVLDCWRAAHREYLERRRPLANRTVLCPLFDGWTTESRSINAGRSFSDGSDGYFWVWGIREVASGASEVAQAQGTR